MKKKKQSVILFGLAFLVLTGIMFGCSEPTSAEEPVVRYLTLTPAASSSFKVSLGYCTYFDVTANLSDGTTIKVTEKCTYTSSNTGVFTITAAQSLGDWSIINPQNTGDATMTVSYGGVDAHQSVTVYNDAITSLHAYPDSLTIGPSMPYQLAVSAYAGGFSLNEPTYLFHSNVTSSCSYSSSNPDVASVSATGLVTGVAAGSVTIRAGLPGGVYTDIPVTVADVEPVSLMLLPTIPGGTPAPGIPDLGEIPIGVGVESWPHKVIANMSDGSMRDVTAASNWVSSNSAISTVRRLLYFQPGYAPHYEYAFKVNNYGDSTITISYSNLSCRLKVYAPLRAQSITVSPSQLTINQGDTAQITVTAHYNDGSAAEATGQCTFDNSTYIQDPWGVVHNVSYVTVSSAGLVTGVNPGQSTLKIYLGPNTSDITASIPVTVNPILSSISAAPGQVTLNKNETSQLAITAHISDGSSSNVTGTSSFLSDNTAVAVVSATGLITAAGPGSTLVTASCQGKTVQVPVAVSSSISPTTASLDLGTGGDIPVTMDLGGNTLTQISNSIDGKVLVQGSDYTLSGNTVTISKNYLATLSVGRQYTLIFKFSAGSLAGLTFKPTDSSKMNSVIAPANALFDMTTGSPDCADIPVTMSLNGNTLLGIAFSGTYGLVLTPDTDYTVSGDQVTILKSLLSGVGLPVGTTTLIFYFSDGYDTTTAALNIEVVNAGSLGRPQDVAVDAYGNRYVSYDSHQIMMTVAKSGTYFGRSMTAGNTYLIAGNGSRGYSGDGGVAFHAVLYSPSGVAVDASGNLYIADVGNKRIREVAATDGTQWGQPMTAGHIYTVAGVEARGVEVDAAGNLYIADVSGQLQSQTILEMAKTTGTQWGQYMTAGSIYTIASNLNIPYGITLDASGNLYIADTYNNVIRELVATDGTQWGQYMTAGSMYIIAGKESIVQDGNGGYSGDGGSAVQAGLFVPYEVAVDVFGNLYIADTYNEVIREVAARDGTQWGQPMTTGNIYTVASIRSCGLDADASGSLHIADWTNKKIVEMKRATSYTVTYNANEGTGSVPTDSTTYAEGSTVTLLGNTGGLSKTGSTFGGWSYGSASGAVYQPDSSFAMPADNITLYAVWNNVSAQTYNVTYDANGGTGSVPTDINAYTEGSTVTVLSNTGSLSKTDCAFGGWSYGSVSGAVYQPGNTFAMPAGGIKLYTVWNAGQPQTYNVSIGSLTGGAITASPTSATAGSTINLTVTPDSGKRLKAGTLKYNNGTQDTSITGTSFTMPAANVTVSAEFEDLPAATYNVSIGPLIGGSITANPASGTAGTTINLTVTPDSGKQLQSGTLKYNDGNQDTTIVGTSFTMPVANVTVTGGFETVSGTVYSVNIGSLTGGIITPNPAAATAGSTINLTIAPVSGKRIKSGTLKYNDGTNDTVITGTSFTMPATNVTVSAEFETIPATTYNVSIGTLSGGSITANPASATAGTTINLTITPDSGKQLQSGTLKYNDGNQDTTIVGTSFTMPVANVTVTGGFETVSGTVYSVNIGSLTGGSITANPASATAGSTINLTVTPDSGKRLKSGTLKYNDGTQDTTITGTSFTMPATNVTVSAEFETIPAATYNVSIGTLSGGSIIANPGSGTVGTTINLTITPDSGKQLKAGTLKYNDGNQDTTITGTSFTMPVANVTVSAEFETIPATTYNVSIGTLSGGSITANPASATAGSTINLTVTPDSGKRLMSGTLKYNDGTQDTTITGTSFTMPAANVTVTAEFEAIPAQTYNISIGTLSGGSITASQTSATAGTTINLTVTPDSGKQLKSGTLKYNDGNQDTTIIGTSFSMPGTNVTVSAEFEDLPAANYNVNIGTLSGGGITANPSSGTAGTTINLTITPDSGKRLKAGTLKYNDGNQDTTITGTSFTMPATNVTVSAEFEDLPAATYNVSIGTLSGGSITPNPASATAGTTINLTITPDSGKQLKAGTLKYNDGTQDTTIVGTSFTMPAANVTVSAEFEAVPPTTIAVTGVTLNKTSTSIEKGSSETLAATIAPTDTTNKKVTWVSDQPGIASVDQTGIVTAVAEGTATITAITADGNKTAACQVTVTESVTTVTASTDQTIPISGPTTVIVPQGVTGAKTNVDPANPLPLIKVNVSTALGTIQAEIPDGTTVSGPAGWSGEIVLPTVKASSSVTITGAQTVDTVIEIGLGNETIKFSKAVRLLIPNMAGKSAGYVRNGVFTPIAATISADSQSTADTQISDGGEAKINVGNDLVIWTKHFTEFVAYTPITSPLSGGGGGGGGGYVPQPVNSSTGSATVYPTAGGKIGLGSDAIVEIPANALQGTSGVAVKVQKVESPSSIPEGFKLGSDVFEFTVDGKTSYSFNKPVTITLKLNTTADAIPAIYYYDSQSSKFIKVGGMVSGSTISVSVDHFTKYTVLAENQTEIRSQTQPPAANNQNGFTDLDKHWAKQSIDTLASLGAVSGYPDGSFKPDAPITRAEFATILVKALKLTASGNGSVFKDTAGHWASADISIAAESGLISGYGDNCFKPDSLITREEMAVIAVKAVKLQQASGETSFTDNALISPWAKGSMKAIVNTNIMTGYPGNTIRPQDNATRAEAVTVIRKLVNNGYGWKRGRHCLR